MREIYGTEGCSTRLHLDERSCFICASACQEQHFQFQENQQSAYSVDILWERMLVKSHDFWWISSFSGEIPSAEGTWWHAAQQPTFGDLRRSRRKKIAGCWCPGRKAALGWSPRLRNDRALVCIRNYNHIDNLLYIDIYIYRDHSVKVWQLWVLWCAYATRNRFLSALDGYIP